MRNRLQFCSNALPRSSASGDCAIRQRHRPADWTSSGASRRWWPSSTATTPAGGTTAGRASGIRLEIKHRFEEHNEEIEESDNHPQEALDTPRGMLMDGSISRDVHHFRIGFMPGPFAWPLRVQLIRDRRPIEAQIQFCPSHSCL